ncbi:MAG: hypothetical protein JW941_04470 [Candidatus Coatesbacteria bacterium]|nr:hypothetical protein [Candidatus Coatesbacteria bacterium]
MFYSSQRKAAVFRAAIWGIEGAGKTETLEGLISQLPPEVTRGNWLGYHGISERDKSSFLEYVPIRLGEQDGINLMLELFSPQPDQRASETWLEIVSGADGIIVVVDSQLSRLTENIDHLAVLKDLLANSNRSLMRIPVVCQFNKRDLPDILPFEVLERLIGLRTAPAFETIASQQLGVLDAIRALRKLLIRSL